MHEERPTVHGLFYGGNYVGTRGRKVALFSSASAIVLLSPSLSRGINLPLRQGSSYRQRSHVASNISYITTYIHCINQEAAVKVLL